MIKLRVWEETWTASTGAVWDQQDPDNPIEVLEIIPNGDRARRDAVAKLAAQAPAMATLLLELYNDGHHPGGGDDACGYLCWSCGAEKRYGPKPGVDPKAPGSWIYHPFEHRSDCELGKILRLAGVIE